MKKHYNAFVEIRSVENEPGERASSSNGYKDKEAKRRVADVMSLHLKADTLEALTTKIINHVKLVEE